MNAAKAGKHSRGDKPVVVETQGYSGSSRTNTFLDAKTLARREVTTGAKGQDARTPRAGATRGQQTRAHAHRPVSSPQGGGSRGGARSTHARGNGQAPRGQARSAHQQRLHAAPPSQFGKQQLDNSLIKNSGGASRRGVSNFGQAPQGVSAARGPKPLTIILGIVALVILFLVVSIILNPKIYSGVKVGEVDVAGLTQEEAAQKISDYYTPRIEGAQVTVYAGDKGRESAEAGKVVAPEDLSQLSYTDEDGNTCYWLVDQTDLGAYIDSASLAEAAYQVGRDDGGFLSRLGSFFFGTTVDMTCKFNATQLESFANVVDATLGDPRVDWNIQVVDGVASTVAGKDGMMSDRATLKSSFSSAFLSSDSASSSFTADVEVASVRIDEEAAQAVADQVTNAIANGATFTYESSSWANSAVEIGSWVTTSVEGTTGSWKLVPSIDQTAFSKEFFSNVSITSANADLQVSFETQGDAVTVHTNGAGSMPQVSQARSDLVNALFGQNASHTEGVPVSITVQSGAMPETMTFDEAVDSHVITEVSSYTTGFTTYSGTEARNINIQIGASYLNNSICEANGGSWSFNELVGDTTPDKGYQAAGSIAAGEYVETYGGGICQVATTMFNALFESPYKITERHNHSLYISSYPAGRDAAIAWDMLDLMWKNESSSDVLVKTATDIDEGSVTVTLYSVPITFSVTSETGDFEEVENDKYSIEVEYDEYLAKGYSYVKQSGVDGSKITVVRSVYDENGGLMYSNTFTSTYKSKDEIIVAGPGTEVDTKRTDTGESSSAA